ncbi:MAG: nitrate reductase molybdenum cofactor assembly chaperone [Pseudomonadota bacterium]
MLIYKLLSALLEYPDQELQDNLPEIRSLLKDAEVSDEDRAALAKFVDWMAASDLTELQADYVQTFDLTPENSLHLMHHLYADDRRLGPAMIDLTEYYKARGLKASEGELPDYLPLILEFVAALDEAEGRVFLNRTVKVLSQLAASLEKAESPYAPLVRIVESFGQLERIAA